MKIVITIQHPAHVHFFKHAIRLLERAGHRVDVFARVKDLVPYLLDAYGIDHTILADEPTSKRGIPLTQLRYEYRLLAACRRIRPDVIVSIGGPASTHVASLCGATSLLFTDTEHARFELALSVPFADRVYTATSFQEDLGDHQIRYPGFHELAYLHPNRFEPADGIRSAYGIDPDRKLVVIRQISWDAAHDVGHSGFDSLETLVSGLEAEDVQVRITAEGGLPPRLEPYGVSVPPERLHDLLYHADVLVGESGTMTIESAVLGTPVVFVSSYDAGVIQELESTYGLVHTPEGDDRTAAAVACAKRVLGTEPAVWERRRRRLLDDKIDMTAYIVDQIRELDGASDRRRPEARVERTEATPPEAQVASNR
ncbi:MAG: DUF354 domain-containing protein [Halohasta sp.]